MNPTDLAVLNPSRFHEILKNLTESDDGKLHILKVIYEVWRNHPQVKTAQMEMRDVCAGTRTGTDICVSDDRRVGG